MTEKNKHHSQLIFRRENYIIMIIGLVIITLGFLLMSGGGSDNPEVFDDSVFNFQRIRLAPTLVLIGFAIEIVAILYNPKKNKSK